MLTDLAAVVLIKSQGRRTLITKQKPAAAMWPQPGPMLTPAAVSWDSCELYSLKTLQPPSF